MVALARTTFPYRVTLVRIARIAWSVEGRRSNRLGQCAYDYAREYGAKKRANG